MIQNAYTHIHVRRCYVSNVSQLIVWSRDYSTRSLKSKFAALRSRNCVNGGDIGGCKFHGPSESGTNLGRYTLYINIHRLIYTGIYCTIVHPRHICTSSWIQSLTPTHTQVHSHPNIHITHTLPHERTQSGQLLCFMSSQHRLYFSLFFINYHREPSLDSFLHAHVTWCLLLLLRSLFFVCIYLFFSFFCCNLRVEAHYGVKCAPFLTVVIHTHYTRCTKKH